MAWITEIPTFTPGEPGFAAKLNQLGEALRETRNALDEATEAVEDGAAEEVAPAPVEVAPAAKRARKADA